jgi:hypothetical protein
MSRQISYVSVFSIMADQEAWALTAVGSSVGAAVGSAVGSSVGDDVGYCHQNVPPTDKVKHAPVDSLSTSVGKTVSPETQNRSCCGCCVLVSEAEDSNSRRWAPRWASPWGRRWGSPSARRSAPRWAARYGRSWGRA